MTPAVGTTAPEAVTRPRVEGDREQQILDATLDVLADVGYDRLTMDAVAAHARASKATLYRRWSTKAALVIDALISEKQPMRVPDTGTLRGDLLGTYCGMGGLTDTRQVAILASVMTAISRDAEFAEAFHRDFIGPKVALTKTIYDRAKERGEISADVDVDFIGTVLPGIVLHRQFLLGLAPDPEFITQVLDQIVLPAVAAVAVHPHQDPHQDPHQNTKEDS